jgi:hypothetical protein
MDQRLTRGPDLQERYCNILKRKALGQRPAISGPAAMIRVIDCHPQSKVVLSESSGIEWYRVTSSDGYIIDEAIHE